jgi:hypothetical protein
MAGCDATDKVKALLRKMAAAKIEEGHTDPETILSHIHDAIQDHTPLHRGEIADIITGHGGQKATKTDLQNRVAAFYKELRDLRATQDKLGPRPPEPVNRDPARAKAIETKIAEVQRQMDYGNDTPEVGAAKEDSPRIAALKAQLADLQQQRANLEPSPPATRPLDPNVTRNKALKTSLENRIADLQSKIAEGDTTDQGKFQMTRDARNKELQSQLDSLTAEWNAMRDPGEEAKTQDRLKADIARLDTKIAAGDKGTARVQGPDSEAVTALKAERKAKNALLNSMKERPVNTVDPNLMKNAARQRVIEKSIKAYEDRMARGDYSTPDPREPPEYSDETKAADQKLANIKAEYKTKLSEFERANRSPAQKIMDAAVNFKRTVWLGSVSILAKLGWAANAKVLTNAMRRMTAGALHHIPGVNWVSRQAPLEGGGFRQQAAGIAEGARHLFSKETTQTFKQNVTRGYSDIAAKYSKEAQNDATTGLLKYIYHTHTGAKTPIEVNSFNTGTKMLTEHYLKDALDRGMSPEKALEHVNSPTMQLFIGQRAYDGGVLYDKLSNANKFTSGIKMLTKFFASGKPGDTSKAFGMAGKFAVDFAMPIMKVGTNFAAQRWAASGGGYINSFVQLMAALKKTPDGLKIALKPDQADYIMRNLSAATLGLAIRALGYYYYKNFSGFYQPGQQTKDKPETAKIAGVHIPRLIFDNDMLTQLQAGATLARVEAKDHSFAAGLWRSEIGEIDGLPMMDTLKNFAHLSEEKSPMRWLGREAASDLIPGDLNWLGQKMDNDTKRKPLPNTKGPKAAWQEFESHLPVLRKNVPRSPNQ